jgi:hypothetical protein
MIENQILGSLLTRDAYARKVVPFISEEYFQSVADKIVFLKIRHYLTEYNSIPTKEALAIELSNDAKLSETEYSDSIDLVDKLSGDPDTNEEWLIDQTEKFCQEKAVYNAIMESIHIIDGEDEDKTKQAIPEILSNALSVSFDN